MSRARATAPFAPDAVLTSNQAAEACGVSRFTIKRRREDGRLPNAYVRPGDETGTFLYPVSDLVADGLLPAGDVRAVPGAAGPAAAVPAAGSSADTVVLREQVAALTAALEQLQARLADRDEELAFLRGLVAGKGRAA